MLSSLQQQRLGRRWTKLRRKRFPIPGKPVFWVLIAFALIALTATSVYFYLRTRDPSSAKSWSMLMDISARKVLINVAPGTLTLSAVQASSTRPENAVKFDMALDLDGAKRIIDALGGIMINIQERIDYKNAGGAHIRIEAGMRRLDADKIEAWFFRPNSSRTASLRAIIIGVAARADELRENGVPTARLLDAALTQTARGEDENNAARLAGLLAAAAQLGPSEIIIDLGEPARAVKPKILAEALPILRVRILNGDGTPRLAARAAERLPAASFSVIETANADRFGYAQSMIRSDNVRAAERTRSALGYGVIESRAPGAGADVEIVLGADARR